MTVIGVLNEMELWKWTFFKNRKIFSDASESTHDVPVFPGKLPMFVKFFELIKDVFPGDIAQEVV